MKKLFGLIILIVLTGSYLGGAGAGQTAARGATADDNALWDDRFGSPGITCCVGFSFDIFTAATGPDGIYVGGSFRAMGNLSGTRGIARWDGRRWHELAGGLADGDILGGTAYDIAVDGDNVYVVGDFDKAGTERLYGIARWNIPAQQWFPVGNGTGPAEADDDRSAPRAVAVQEGNVYIGGRFDQVDGVTAARVARWNGTAWSALAGGVYQDDFGDNAATVEALAGSNGLIYVGGKFKEAINPPNVADIAVQNLAAWNPTTNRWADVGGGASAPVSELTAQEGALYVGGSFTRAGGQVVNGVARWQNNTWSALGSGVDGSVAAIHVGNDGVYVAGSFANASGVADTDSLARWDGSQWHSLRTSEFFTKPDTDHINALGVLPNGNILVGGEFGEDGPRLFTNTAFWNGTRWTGTGLGLEDDSTAFVGGDGFAVAVVPGGDVYVAGEFEYLGGLPFSHIARWDGTQWHDVGGGVDGDVSVLLLRGEELYVGGGFGNVGNNLPAVRVAKWNLRTQTWSAVGNGLPGGYVHDLAFVGDTLFAGGAGFPFETECCLWKLSGATWEPFSPRFITDYFVFTNARSGVYALASDGEQLLVGGFAVDVDRRSDRTRVAEGDLFLYNPTTDSVAGYGKGLAGPSLVAVNAIEITPSGVYVGGEFQSIDGVAAVNLARLTQAGWSGLGVSVLGDDDPLVEAITSNGDELYIAGRFDQVGVNAFNIAKLHIPSNSWSALGCGITRNGETVSSGIVKDLAVQPAGSPNAGLYAVGGIVAAGCVPSTGFAAWYGAGSGPAPNAQQARIPVVAPQSGQVFLPIIEP